MKKILLLTIFLASFFILFPGKSYAIACPPADKASVNNCPVCPDGWQYSTHAGGGTGACVQGSTEKIDNCTAVLDCSKGGTDYYCQLAASGTGGPNGCCNGTSCYATSAGPGGGGNPPGGSGGGSCVVCPDGMTYVGKDIVGNDVCKQGLITLPPKNKIDCSNSSTPVCDITGQKGCCVGAGGGGNCTTSPIADGGGPPGGGSGIDIPPLSSLAIGGIPTGGRDMLNNVLGVAVSVLILIAIILCLFYIIWGAYFWITSEGDKQKLQQARQRIAFAIIGLIVVLLSFAIIKLLDNFFFGTAPISGNECQASGGGSCIPQTRCQQQGGLEGPACGGGVCCKGISGGSTTCLGSCQPIGRCTTQGGSVDSSKTCVAGTECCSN